MMDKKYSNLDLQQKVIVNTIELLLCKCNQYVLKLTVLILWNRARWAFILERVVCHTRQLTLLFDLYSIDVLSKGSLPVDGHA